MILQLKNTTTQDQILQLCDKLKMMGLQPLIRNANGNKAENKLDNKSENSSIAIINGLDENINVDLFSQLTSVDKVIPFHKPFKLASNDLQPSRTVIDIKGTKIGGGHFVAMGGPCSIESKEQIFAIAKAVAKSGATILRGGAFKPRTSPYEFQGLGEEGLKYMSAAAKAYDLLCVSEVLSPEDVPMVTRYVDILQIGSRNMQNFALLKKAGETDKPVLLKRGFSSTYKEFLLAAEYILSAGNPNVILCERGIRSFETHSRNTLDIAAVPMLRELTHLPIIVDPSHGTGIRNIVAPMARAAIAVEADGVIVEVHTDPDNALTDAKQTISTEMFDDMMKTLNRLAKVMNIHIERRAV